ncbi:MAG: hypothetical protein HY274_08045 [Gammaproteobacteria bacterium]|nr:hypothetical protein [Gammaproteobacteria bacterium]
MKCFTVTENGVVPGIKFLREPYPHIPVGDPKLSSNDYRRVEVDASLASGGDATVMKCSYVLDMQTGDKRRASYKLVPATGEDDDQALVKLEAHCAPPGQRSFYDLPLYTFALANGWYLANGTGPQARTPVNLVVLNKGDEVKINRAIDVWKQSEHVFSVAFDGRELKQKNGRRAAA